MGIVEFRHKFHRRFFLKYLIDNMSLSVKVVACQRSAASHYMNQNDTVQ